MVAACIIPMQLPDGEKIEDYLPLVQILAHRLARRLPFFDLANLISDGVLGLFDAAQRYDGRVKVKFKTFAAFRINGSMLDGLRAVDPMSRSRRAALRRLERVRRNLAQRLMCEPTTQELADALGLRLEHLWELQADAVRPSFLSIEMDDEDGTQIQIPDPGVAHPTKQLEDDALVRRVKNAVSTLSPIDRAVITLSFYGGMNQEQIGQTIGVTESRVCQIFDQALLRLKKQLRGVTRE